MFRKISQIRYLVLIIVTPMALGFLVFMTNSLVDPLWYFKGNLITGQNYMWNDRVSKSNLLLKDPDKYDCLILGSSRSILLDPDKIEGYTCFNYSFGLGNINHYVEFLSYFISRSGPPELLIIGVDSTDLLNEDQWHLPGGLQTVPDFVRSTAGPPNAIATYLSFRWLKFSFRTLIGRSPHPIFYRPDFTGDILPGSGPFDPRRLLKPDLEQVMFPFAGFTTDSVEQFRKLRHALTKDTRVIGYTPPISAHYVARLALQGNLDGYLQVLYRIGQLFERFYDFTVPSPWTRNPELTYDGGHYYRPVNDEIARILSGDSSVSGLPVHEMSWPEYRDRFRASVEEFIAEKQIRLPGSPG